MLTALDETLHHQAPLVFDHVVTSDHRFYDRQLMGGFERSGRCAFLAGITAFANMNVLEGFVMVQARSKRQYNVRLTQALRPRNDAKAAIGPLGLDVVTPFRELRYLLEPGEYPVALDITFRNVLPPHLEKPHFNRSDGRIDSDYLRYHQLGELSGWIEVEGERFEATDWYGWRDHSWGVRPAVGGFEPMTGTRTAGGVSAASRTGGKGLFLFYVGFWNGRQGGGFQVIEDGEGKRIYTTGEVHDGADGPAIEVKTVEYEVAFKPGTRVFETLTARLGLANGDTWSIKATAVGRPWVYRGGGYDGGFRDGQAQGVYRSGPLSIETDEYDITDPEKIGFPDGTVGYTKHREQLAVCEINGVRGSAYAPMFVIGDQPRFGLPNR
jgi:hypothetical protein